MAPTHRRLTASVLRTVGVLTAVLGAAGAAGVPAPAAVARAAVRADVPTPTATTSVVTVRTGGDRSADDEVGPLAGVTLGLFADEDATEPVDPAWGVCVSDADGDCSFTVPGTGPGGPREDARYTVRQISVPSGWYTNPVLRTGPGSGSGSIAAPYVFRTPELEGGETYRSTRDFMYGTDWRTPPFTASTGIWQQSRVNPPPPRGCGLDVALVLDLSASVGSALPQLKEAADEFTDALAGTPSRLSLFSFDRESPSTGTENHPEPHSVSTEEGADSFKRLYADWGLGSGTNWDQALYATAKAAPRYDLAVVLTDGNPTRFSKPIEGDGSRTHFADVEGGVFAANALKAKGTRVISVGVGRGVEGVSGLNLRAISGTEAFDGDNPQTADYYQTTDFAAAGAALKNLALSQCAGTVSVIKQIVPEDNTGEDVSGARNAGPGWSFTASSTGDLGGLPATRVTGDDGTGGVVFEPEFPPTTAEAPVTVDETQQPGNTLVTQGGANAVCTNLDDGTSVPVTNSGATGFTVDLQRRGAVSCVVYNRPDPTPAQSADLTVDKRWSIDGRSYAEGDQPDGYEAALRLTGPDGTAATPQPWGTARTGYDRGEQATVSEDVTLPDDCELTRSRVTEVNGSPAGAALPYRATLTQEHNRVTVTNTVTCAAHLTLEKKVVNSHGGSAVPTDWTLTATGPDRLTGPGGAGGAVTPGAYRLTESGGPEGYTSSPWSCTGADGPLTVTGDTVTLPAGARVTCTVTNTDVPCPTPTPTPTPDPYGRLDKHAHRSA
ncbi:hypothetical protein ACIQMP_13595 [Streptomyces sp. NPDC091385]|uniref:prealbumin-like fold domain-containing protein n=1 Tax=Streptomyces sp. NPDC091385 TaxID=3365997 RepID=UPI00380251A4